MLVSFGVFRTGRSEAGLETNCSTEEHFRCLMWLPLPVSVSSRGNRMVLKLLMAMLLHPALCHAGLRARDPDVEEEIHGLRDSEPGTFGTAHFPVPHGHGHHSTAGALQPSLSVPESPLTPLRESSQPPARTGNWCAFVHQRAVTVAVLCGTETYTLKTMNSCSKGDPDCQIAKYQLSSRPVYRQKQKIFTALHWKCCPGHAGHNCEDTERESQSGQEHTKTTQTDVSGVDDSGGGYKETDLLEDGSWDNGPVQQPPSDPVFPVPGHFGTGGAIPPAGSLPFMDSATLLTVHQVYSAVMTHLQPVLDGFNHTLEQLSSNVKGLSMDLQKLKHEQDGRTSSSRPTHTGTIEEKLEANSIQIQQIQSQLNLQQRQAEQTIQFQQEQLQHDLSILKDKIDLHINRSHEDVQASLQSLSQSVEEIRLGQQNLEGVMQGEYAPSARVSEGPPAPVSGMWEAISRLDKKVLNNTMQLSALSENSTHLMNVAQKLDHCLRNLSVRLEQVSQSSEIHFAETGLELEAAKVAAFNSINELATNLSSQERHLRELELYLDSIYLQVQRTEPATAAEVCSCKEIRESLITLELQVANVTDLAKENRYALEDAEATRDQGHWPMQVEDLHQALLSVKESLAFEQAKSRTLQDDLSQLKASLLGSQQEIVGLKESFMAKASEIKRLSASFSSLLKDAIRHSEVLEILLGDEVMEFSSWSDSQQKALSIPVLLQRIRLMQEKIETHENSLVSLRRNQTSPERDQMTSDDPVAFLDWALTEDQGRNAEDHKDDHYLPSPSLEDDDGDYSVSDFWSLGREVEELANRLSQVEQKHCNCSAAPGGSVMELQTEVASLRQDLGDHLKIFQNLFSHTEELANSSHSLNLEQLWTMISRKDRKKKKGPNVKEKGESSSIRRRRNTGKWPAYSPVAFTAILPNRTNTRGTIILEKVSLNPGSAYRPSSGEFHAPQTGLYLFLVSLNFDTGPSLAQLKHDTVPVASLRQVQGQGGHLSQACLLELQRGEKVTLELLKGRLRRGQPNDNTLSVVLLFSTEDEERRGTGTVL
ncbi:multimerin-2 [Salminus brasiliensis]|uniref:multimerin-2 n=1 Tax=Salminus brasiliensis TaxID=930266 RepID=UPI003B834F23